MPRSRTIKPGFFKNEDLADLDPLACLLFAGLWCWADRDGRLEDRPKRLKLEILPGRDCDVDALLGLLAERGFIVRYRVGGAAYIQVLAFDRHQNPHVKEPASTIPPPCPPEPAPDEPGASPVQAPDEHRASPANHSPWVTHHSPLTTQPQQETAVVVAAMATPASPRVGSRPPRVEKQGYDPGFEAWWLIYPRHDGKMPASVAYARRLEAGRTQAELAAAARHLAAHHEAIGTPTEKIPHATTWLNQHRDEEWQTGPPDAERRPAPRPGGPPSKLAQTAANLRDLKALREANGDRRTSFFDLATAGLGVPDPGGRGADAGALPRPPGGAALA